MNREQLSFIPRHTVIQLLYHPKEKVKKIHPEECRLLFEQYPFVKELYDIVHQFKQILKEHDQVRLENWLLQLEKSPYKELHSFVKGIKKDFEAVHNAVKFEYSNGLVEGSINKIKVIKRIMYGRCSFQLLRNKILLLEKFHSQSFN